MVPAGDTQGLGPVRAVGAVRGLACGLMCMQACVATCAPVSSGNLPPGLPADACSTSVAATHCVFPRRHCPTPPVGAEGWPAGRGCYPERGTGGHLLVCRHGSPCEGQWVGWLRSIPRHLLHASAAGCSLASASSGSSSMTVRAGPQLSTSAASATSVPTGGCPGMGGGPRGWPPVQGAALPVWQCSPVV